MASVTLSVRMIGRDTLSNDLIERQVDDVHDIHKLRKEFGVAGIEPESGCRRIFTKRGICGASDHELKRLERTIEDWLGTLLCLWQQE